MKRVLYFGGHRMVAQEWLDNKLVNSTDFEPDEQGYELFSAYLKSFKNQPVKLLVDLIEEEFRQIQIPFLRGADRKALINRNYIKYFRHSKYRLSISQSVKKDGRKEENLLLIGLTNENLLKPWLEIIDKTCTPLSGIITLPLLSVEYAKSLKLKSKAIILVSQQTPSNLRQSVFVNDMLVLSRQVPIASFMQSEYAKDVIRDIRITKRYLVSQRIIENTEPLEVHILTNKSQFESVKMTCAENNDLDFKIFEINELLKSQKIQIDGEQDFSIGLFTNLASKKLFSNHYSQSVEKKYYRHYLTNLTFKFLTMVVLVVGFGLTVNSFTKSWLYERENTEMNLIEQKYRAKYNLLNEGRVDSNDDISTNSMQNIIQTIDEINKEYLNDPQQMLSIISQDISIFPDLRIRKVDWFVSNYADTLNAASVNWSEAQSRRNSENTEVEIPHTEGLFEIVTIEAEFLNFKGNYRYALSVVEDLEKAMSESGKYDYVVILKKPLDIEPSSNLSGDLGKNKDTVKPVANLTFHVVREVKNEE